MITKAIIQIKNIINEIPLREMNYVPVNKY